MKKKVISILLAAAMVMSMAACGEKAADMSAEEKKQGTEE